MTSGEQLYILLVVGQSVCLQSMTVLTSEPEHEQLASHVSEPLKQNTNDLMT